MTSPHVLRLQASEDTTTKSWRFKSGLLHCFSPFVTFVRQCGKSRDQCGRTAAHRPTHFCKNAGPIILPEANLVLPPTEGVASCGEESWVVYALREAQQKNGCQLGATVRPLRRNRLRPKNRQPRRQHQEKHPRPRRQED